MVDQPCTSCGAIDSTVAIRSPDHLRDVLDAVKGCLRSGAITEMRKGTVSVLEIEPDGPRPDFIASDFQCCRCGRRYELRVETFHGAGGTWKPSR